MKKLLGFILVASTILSCEDIIGVENISGETVTLLAPTNGATLTSTTVGFSWNEVVDAEHYRLVIATPSFESANQVVLDSTLTATNFNTTLSGNSYEWRIKALNSGYETGYTTQSFIVEISEQVNISNETVVLLAPSNGVLFSTTDTLNFSWEVVSGAEHYTIQLATPDFENAIEILENATTNNTNYSISNLEAGDYEWRVRAVNLNYETEYTTNSFTVDE